MSVGWSGAAVGGEKDNDETEANSVLLNLGGTLDSSGKFFTNIGAEAHPELW